MNRTKVSVKSVNRHSDAYVRFDDNATVGRRLRISCAKRARACSLDANLLARPRAKRKEGRRSTETCPKGAKRHASCDGRRRLRDIESSTTADEQIRVFFEIWDFLPERLADVEGDAPSRSRTRERASVDGASSSSLFPTISCTCHKQKVIPTSPSPSPTSPDRRRIDKGRSTMRAHEVVKRARGE